MNKEELSKLRMNIQLFAEEADNADDKSDATDAGSDDNENITFTDGDANNTGKLISAEIFLTSPVLKVLMDCGNDFLTEGTGLRHPQCS